MWECDKDELRAEGGEDSVLPKGQRRGYLSVVQLSESSARVGQQEVAAQDGHFIAKLHVLQWAV